MANQPGTLEQIAIGLARAIARLTERLKDQELQDTLARLGIVFPPALLAEPAVAAARNGLVTAAGDLPGTIDGLIAAVQADDLQAIIQRGLKLLTDVNALIEAFNDLPDAINTVRGAFPEIGDAQFAEFAAGFARKLLDLLIADVLDDVPAVGASLALVGLLERVRPFAAADSELFEFERTTIHYGRITKLLGAPADYFRTIYDWGSPTFDGTKLLPALSEFLARLDVPTAYHGAIEETTTLLQAYVLDITPNTAIDPPGLDIGIVAPFGGTIDESFALPNPAWSGSFSARGRFGTVLTGSVRPPLHFSVASPTTSFEGEAKVNVIGKPAKPFLILGQAGGNRIEVKTIKFASGVKFSATAGPSGAEPFVEGELEGGRVIIDGSSGDGFITKVLSGVKIDSSFNAGLAWNLSTGLRFDGSSTLTIMLPVHAELGPFSVSEIFLVGTLKDESILFELSVSLSVKLGPLQAVVTQIGFLTDITFPDTGGNVGPALIDFAFKPPNGVGLSLDVGGFKGGGFLMLDHEKGEYAGALELDFKGLFSVKAIGIINTKMPDGSKGFSLLIIITAEFTPIQLSFGFTLNGVGGIFGLNRRINVAALADGIRTNAVKSILFPQDIIANITRIISDIKQFFPPQPDHFVVGPMAKLGWGTPSIITVELGLLLDLPNPMFAIVGVLKAMLPAEDAPLLRLQINFIGIVDFDRGYIFFRADLFDSRLLVYSITGSMAFLVSWGEAQTFALSVGGFHPDFRDIPSIPALPDGFRNMARIGLSLLSDDNPRLKVESYFAVTSNTVQFGARVELYASAGGFNIYGFLGYDVLFQFDPFRFLANISGGVALRRGSSTIAGINVSATLSGPTPWDARGKASISFFFFSISVGFHVTWGDPPPAISPATEDLLALLQREFNDTRNWRAELPSNNHLHVSLRKIEPPAGQELLVIHPAGVLTFSQRSLPLEDYLIQKFGNKKPQAQNKFKLSNANSGGPDIPADYQGVREQFAPGNFTELSDSEKLSRRSFEKLPSGFKLTATNDLLVATPVTRSVVYELSYLRRKTLVFKDLVTLVVRAYDRLVKGSSVRQSTLAHQQNRLSLNAPKQVTLPEEGFAIASTADLKSHLQNGAGAVVFATQAEAYQRQSELIALNPSLAGSLQVVSNFELNLN